MASIRVKIPVLLALWMVLSAFSYNTMDNSNSSNLGILISNSIVGTAKAESQFFSTSYNGDACWNASFTNNLVPCPTPPDENIDICLVENESTSVPVYYYTSNDVINNYYATTLTNPLIGQSPLTGLTINPIYLSTTTPYLTDFNRINYQLDLTAPAVPFGTSPILTTVDIDGDFDVQGSNQNLSHDVLANVRMEHINTGPALSNLSPTNHNQVLTSPSSTISLPVSVDYSDNENNQANLIFELSNDNFSTILQTQNVNSVTSGSTVNTTFTNLGVGQYQWRVSATEIDASGNCIGYANEDPPINLSAQIGPTNLTLTSGTELLASTGSNKYTIIFAALAGLFAGLVIFVRSLMQMRD